MIDFDRLIDYDENQEAEATLDFSPQFFAPEINITKKVYMQK